MSNQQPSQEDVRRARHAGFQNSTTHINDNARTRITKSYAAQDARRERNISNFTNNLRGGK